MATAPARLGAETASEGFVLPLLPVSWMPHDQEARGVVRLVFDAFGDIVQNDKYRSCGTPCDGGDTGVV